MPFTSYKGLLKNTASSGAGGVALDQNFTELADRIGICRYTSIVDPTIIDDASAGFSKGSRWINTTTGFIFDCVDPTVGAAKWVNLRVANNLDTIGNPLPNTRLKNSNVLNLYNVQAYGATGDGVTNDTAAIIATITACPEGGTVYFPTPAVGYLVIGSGTEIFLITKNINLLGVHGQKSLILVDSSVPNTRDVFRVAVPSRCYFQSIENLNIQPVSGSPARHALNIDVTAAGAYQSDMLVRRNFFGLTGGDSIHLTNPTNTDGWFTSKILHNLLLSGMNLLRLGDSMIIEGNSFGRLGPDYFGANKTAIVMSAVPGACRCVIRNNNCVMQGGFLRALSAEQLTIEGNTVEITDTCSMPESAAVALVGSDAQIKNVRVVANNFNAMGHADRTLLIDNAVGTFVDSNNLVGSLENIRITANALNTVLGPNGVPDLSTFTDLGTGTSWPRVTSTSGRLTLSATLVVPTAYTGTGLGLSPLAGTYLIIVNSRIYQGSGAGAVFLKIRNTTDSTDAGSEKTAVDFPGYTDQTVSLAWIITLPYGKHIELYARSAAGTESLLVNPNGGTDLHYVRIA